MVMYKCESYFYDSRSNEIIFSVIGRKKSIPNTVLRMFVKSIQKVFRILPKSDTRILKQLVYYLKFIFIYHKFW